MTGKLTPKTYDTIANTCLIVAVISTFMFDRGYHIIGGCIGAVAGVAAIVLYFYNIWE